MLTPIENVKKRNESLSRSCLFCGECFQCKIVCQSLSIWWIDGERDKWRLRRILRCKEKLHIYPLPTGFDSKVGAAVKSLLLQ